MTDYHALSLARSPFQGLLQACHNTVLTLVTIQQTEIVGGGARFHIPRNMTALNSIPATSWATASQQPIILRTADRIGFSNRTQVESVSSESPRTIKVTVLW